MTDEQQNVVTLVTSANMLCEKCSDEFLRSIAQRIHQAFHGNAADTWRDCSKGICSDIRRELAVHVCKCPDPPASWITGIPFCQAHGLTTCGECKEKIP